MGERTVAVIGANGQLGTALAGAFGRQRGWRVLPLVHQQIEITDGGSIARALEPAPDVVVNTAFWPGEEPEPALRVNALGPRLLAEHCAARGAWLVHVSTDYVFDGSASRPYRETDRTEPRSVYGISKVAGEQLVRSCLARHLIVRVSGLYGPVPSRAKGHRHFVSTVLEKASRGETITVPADQVFSPTYAPDAAATIVRLLEVEASGTFHVTNTGACSWYEFAQAILELAGRPADLRPIHLADLPPVPPRPRYSVLAHDALHAAGIPSPRPWREALREYIDLSLGAASGGAGR
jgi:dTDP-4-dehydrorhamnose reductase